MDPHLDPLLAVDLHTVSPQRGDGTVDDLLHHLRVPIGFLQLSCRDPDVPVCRNILPGLI